MFDETHYYIARLLEGADDQTINREILTIRARTAERPRFSFNKIGVTVQKDRAIFQRTCRDTREAKGFIVKIEKDKVELREIN